MTITLDQILDYCNYLINKSQSADAISPDEFNSVLPVVNQEVFNKELTKVMQAYGQPGFVDSYKNSYLRDIEDYYESVARVGSSMTLPDGYELFVSGKAMVGSDWEPLMLTSSLNAFDNVEGMMGANDENVICWVSGSKLYFNSSVDSVKMFYVKRPVNPFYDYCVREYSNFFLPVGSTVEYDGLSSYYATINGVNYQGVTPGYQTWNHDDVYSSVTKEFVFNDKLITSIVNLIFEKMGINIREQIPIELSQIKKKEQ